MLLSELKRQTNDQHQRLESELDISSQIANLDRYRRLLASFYGWWAPWESRLAASNNQEVLRFYAPRRKRLLLQEDLRALGLTDREIDDIPLAEMPGFASESQWLGSMYVAEGSTLGGQIITRMIEERLRLRDGRGYSFYKSYGSNVGSMWKEFGSFFDARVAPEQLQEAVTGARETFEGIREWLSGMR